MTQPAFPGGVTGEDPDLTQRQRQIFLALLQLHGRTARSVSSEALGRLRGIRWSPASIRMALGDLEGMGLVEREHASSGRAPSATGYAFYVRNELTPAPLPAEVLRQIDERLLRSAHDVEELIHEASRLLSDLTRQLGLAVSASLDRERLAGLELASLEPGRSLLVLTLGGGVVRTLLLELENPLERGELDDVTAVLRERLVGLDVSQVRERLAFDPELVRDTAVRIVTRAAMASWARPSATTLYSAGAGNVASQPEFADRRQLGALLRLIENGPPLDRLMIDGVEGQPAVRVALDEDLALNGCSLVSYPLPGANRVGIGVLGPLRMDYARVVSVVDAVGSRVAGVL